MTRLYTFHWPKLLCETKFVARFPSSSRNWRWKRLTKTACSLMHALPPAQNMLLNYSSNFGFCVFSHGSGALSKTSGWNQPEPTRENVKTLMSGGPTTLWNPMAVKTTYRLKKCEISLFVGGGRWVPKSMTKRTPRRHVQPLLRLRPRWRIGEESDWDRLYLSRQSLHSTTAGPRYDAKCWRVETTSFRSISKVLWHWHNKQRDHGYNTCVGWPTTHRSSWGQHRTRHWLSSMMLTTWNGWRCTRIFSISRAWSRRMCSCLQRPSWFG